MAKTINSILRGVFDQCILHGLGNYFSLFLTLKLKLLGIANLACRLVFTKIFQKIDFELMTSFL